MLKPRDQQGSFYDPEYICEQLIPQDSFYRKFREVVWPIVKDEDFDSMYCKDNGRPPFRPHSLRWQQSFNFIRIYLIVKWNAPACTTSKSNTLSACDWMSVHLTIHHLAISGNDSLKKEKRKKFLTASWSTSYKQSS